MGRKVGQSWLGERGQKGKIFLFHDVLGAESDNEHSFFCLLQFSSAQII